MKPASRVMRGVSYFGAGFVSALVVVFCWSVRSPSSRLTSDLPADYKLASAKFDARVRSRFPSAHLSTCFQMNLKSRDFGLRGQMIRADMTNILQKE